MHINVKFPNFNLEIDIEDDSTVEQLRATCAAKLNSEPNGLCLVYKGKIMKDKDKLTSIDVIDGCSIHCAFKKITPESSSQASTTTSQTQINNTPAPLPTSSTQSATSLPNIIGSMDSQTQTQFLRLLAESPEISRLFTDPSFMDTLMAMDPRMKLLCENYPEVGQAMRNPEVMRTVLELFRNPQALQEATRNQERLLTTLQNTPNGLNQYARFLNELNRVSPSASTTHTLQNIQASQQAPSDSSTANISGEAMPNPWSSSSTQHTTSQTSQSTVQPQATTSTDRNANDNPLLRDIPRILRFSNIEVPAVEPIFDRIRNCISNLSPRGQYGLTELLKGMEVLREENPELALYLLQYQAISAQAFYGSVMESLGQGDSVPPESGNENTYQNQLQELQVMGFENKDENLEALRYSYGDVNGAVDFILRRRGIQ